MCTYQLLCSDSILASQILKKWPPATFKQSFDIFYKGQTPNVGIFLVKGAIQFFDTEEKQIFLGPALVCLSELRHQVRLDCTVKILEGSVACIIDRVSLNSFLVSHQELDHLITNEDFF